MRLEDLVSWRLALAGRLLRTTVDAELGDLVGAQALGVLMRLGERDGQRQAELARRQRVEGPSMCRMIDRLERDGLVARAPDPDDRRAVSVRLTPRGRRTLEQGTRVVEGIERRVLDALDPAERAQLAGLLGRLVDALGDAGEHG